MSEEKTSLIKAAESLKQKRLNAQFRVKQKRLNEQFRQQQQKNAKSDKNLRQYRNHQWELYEEFGAGQTHQHEQELPGNNWSKKKTPSQQRHRNQLRNIETDAWQWDGERPGRPHEIRNKPAGPPPSTRLRSRAGVPDVPESQFVRARSEARAQAKAQAAPLSMYRVTRGKARLPRVKRDKLKPQNVAVFFQ